MKVIYQAIHQMVKLGNVLNWEKPIDQGYVDALNGLRAVRDALEGSRTIPSEQTKDAGMIKGEGA